MIDIETLATSSRAVVLSVAAVRFKLYSTAPAIDDVCFKAVLNIREQLAVGREVDMEVLRWWGLQSDKARAHWVAPRPDAITHPRTALVNLGSYLNGTSRVWCCGPSFDAAIIESLCANFDLSTPWGYSAPRDVRTIRDFDQRREWKRSTDDIDHDPLSDCRFQIHTLWERWPEDLPPPPPSDCALAS